MALIPKPLRGSLVLEREQRKRDADKIEREEKAASKAFDGHRCRWPEKHICRGPLESAHIKDASLGGDMARQNLVTLCAWIHRRGPESIHGKQLRIEAETALGSQGALSFWRQDENGEYYCVTREIRPGQIEKD